MIINPIDIYLLIIMQLNLTLYLYKITNKYYDKKWPGIFKFFFFVCILPIEFFMFGLRQIISLVVLSIKKLHFMYIS